MSIASASPTTNASPRGTSGAAPNWLWPAVGLAAAVLLVIVGFGLRGGVSNEQLPDGYGRRRGTDNVRSPGGISVLAEMFKAAGHRVTSTSRLSPRLNDSDILVWAPDDFEPPTTEQREFLEEWLGSGSGRVLIYIGRDYDAAADYWNRVLPTAPPEDQDEVRRRREFAEVAYKGRRAEMPDEQYARWFTVRGDKPAKKITSLEGKWAEGIDPQKTSIVVRGRLEIPAAADVAAGEPALPGQFEPLLRSQGDMLATRVTDPSWGDGEVIVLVNGSWVLNYPLVNREHRKLAARLVNECGAAEGRVTFIESGPGGPPVLDREPSGDGDSPLAFMDVWPINAIIIHLTILGIVLCLARSPIFGRPRDLPSEPAADFGKHVAALGELLARTQDRNYAQGRLLHYRQLAKRESGKSHRKAKNP
jgi:hypothetical protein